MGSLGLLALFGVFYTLSGDSGVGFDGDQVETAAQGDAGNGTSDVLGDVTMSESDGQVRSFASGDTDSVRSGDGAGLALRVVTDGRPSGSTASDGVTTSSSSTTSPSSSTAGSESSSTSSAGAGDGSSTSSTNAAPTTARETSTTQRRTTTTKAPASSSSMTTSTTSATVSSTSTTAATTTTAGSSSNARNFEQEVIRLTNEERSAGGCGPLTNNDMLHNAALGHSVDMAENDYFSHTSQDGSSMVDRVERQGYRWRSLAENIAAGYRSPSAVVDGWMNSSGHRANILNCSLTEIGVGFHNYYWTQNFGTPR